MSALDEMYAAIQVLMFEHHINNHRGQPGSIRDQDCCVGTSNMIVQAGQELAALRAENAAMRDALERIAKTNGTWSCEIARTALGGRDA